MSISGPPSETRPRIGTCAVSPESLPICQLTNLAVGSVATIDLAWRFLAEVDSAVRARVNADPLDPTPGNNISIVPLPEPGLATLLPSGCACVAFLGCRRNRRKRNPESSSSSQSAGFAAVRW